jgi:hypothetical protein
MWEKAVLTYFKVLSLFLHGEIKVEQFLDGTETVCVLNLIKMFYVAFLILFEFVICMHFCHTSASS